MRKKGARRLLLALWALTPIASASSSVSPSKALAAPAPEVPQQPQRRPQQPRRRKRRRSPASSSQSQSQSQSPTSSPSPSAGGRKPPSASSPRPRPPRRGAGSRDGATSASSRRDAILAPYMEGTTPWARRYLRSVPEDALLPVPKEFLSDGFNLQGLQRIVEGVGRGEQVAPGLGPEATAPAGGPSAASSKQAFPLYRAAVRLILGRYGGDAGGTSELPKASVQRAAVALYCLVHARYASSPRGLDTLRRIITKSRGSAGSPPREGLAIFGRCPRVGCRGMPLLPAGLSDSYGSTAGSGGADRWAMRYCCSCGEALHHLPSKVDGAAWGTSLPHLFLMTHGLSVFSGLVESQRLGGGRGREGDLRREGRPLGGCEIAGEGGGAVGGLRPSPQIFGFPVDKRARVRYPILECGATRGGGSQSEGS